MLNNTLKGHINELWNKFWAGGISNPITAIEQINYLLFMKRIDTLDAERQAQNEKNYNSVFSGDYTAPLFRQSGIEHPPIKDKSSLRWSAFSKEANDKTLTKEEADQKNEALFKLVRDWAFPFMKELNGNNSFFTKHMRNAVFVIPNARLLADAIGKIEDLYQEIETGLEGQQTFQDTTGDIYEYLLSELNSAGKNGQFRTPRHIIKLLTELVDPKLKNPNNPEEYYKICDPACGTGGFILGAYQYIVSQHSIGDDYRKEDEDGFMRGGRGLQLSSEDWKVIRGEHSEQDSFYGYDIDTTMVRIGLMNLLMHGIDKPRVDYTDTLSKSYEEENQYQYILANPPFTGNIDKGDINEKLSGLVSTSKTELLFLARIYQMLRMGGTAGVIIPQGVLFGSSKAFVETRKILLNYCQLEAVISLPSGVFKPYAGVATAILLFTKIVDVNETSAGDSGDYNVWFYDMQSDGYSLDDRRNKLDNNGDLQKIIEHYKIRSTEKIANRKGQYFHVPKTEIADNNYDLSFNKYKEIEYEEEDYGNPKDIIKELDKFEEKIIAGLAKLKNMLKIED